MKQGFTVLGPAEESASAENFLGIIATGDASVDAAYKMALSQRQGADAFINVTVNQKATSFLGLYAQYRTIVRGTAIRRAKAVTGESAGALVRERVPEAIDPNLLAWRRKILDLLLGPSRSLELYAHWRKFGGRNNLGKPEEWVNSLQNVDYQEFITSGMKLEAWLKKRFEK